MLSVPGLVMNHYGNYIYQDAVEHGQRKIERLL